MGLNNGWLIKEGIFDYYWILECLWFFGSKRFFDIGFLNFGVEIKSVRWFLIMDIFMDN